MKKNSATIKVVVLKLERNVHVICGWLREEWAGPMFWQSSSRQSANKGLFYLKHTHIQCSNLILWEDSAKMTAAFSVI